MFTSMLNNETITANGFQILDSLNSSEMVLIINIMNSPTGTAPSLIFTIADVDPIDQTTIVGNQVTSTTISSSGAVNLRLKNSVSDTIKVSWVLSGSSSPTFTGVNLCVVQKELSERIAINSTASNVSASASNVTLLSSNQNRLGAAFQNDSTNILYLKLGASSSLTSYTVKIISNSYYELPFNYTGIVTGIWDGTNSAVRITELW